MTDPTAQDIFERWQDARLKRAMFNVVCAVAIDPRTQIERIIGYNPNLLLTDQRSELVKFAAGQVLGEVYQPTITNPPYGHEMIVPKGVRLAFPSLYDKKQVQEELRRTLEVTPRFRESYGQVGYSAQIAAVGAERFSAQMQKISDQMARMQEMVWLKMIFGTQTHSDPGDMFHREYRIGTLLFSSDRRQRKRGKRLFDKWHKTRSGIKWTRDEKRALLRMGYGRAREPLDHIEPNYYRKD